MLQRAGEASEYPVKLVAARKAEGEARIFIEQLADNLEAIDGEVLRLVEVKNHARPAKIEAEVMNRAVDGRIRLRSAGGGHALHQVAGRDARAAIDAEDECLLSGCALGVVLGNQVAGYVRLARARRGINHVNLRPLQQPGEDAAHGAHSAGLVDLRCEWGFWLYRGVCDKAGDGRADARGVGDVAVVAVHELREGVRRVADSPREVHRRHAAANHEVGREPLCLRRCLCLVDHAFCLSKKMRAASAGVAGRFEG